MKLYLLRHGGVTPQEMTPTRVRAGIQRSLDRLGVPTIDLLQFHWWNFEHPGYLDAMRELALLRREGVIAELGVTNFDTDHLRLLVKHGIPIVSNQVCFSLLDRRVATRRGIMNAHQEEAYAAEVEPRTGALEGHHRVRGAAQRE